MEREMRAEVVVVSRLTGEGDDPKIVVKHWYGDSTFRVAVVTEKLTRDERGERYKVQARGPRQTAKGNDHASTGGEQSWETGTLHPSTPPEEVAALCVGRDALAARLVDIEPTA